MKTHLFRAAGAALFFAASMSNSFAQTPVTTGVEFGSFINCIVQNNFNRPILIRSIQYQMTGALGPGNTSITCVQNCGLSPGNFNKFTGPANDPRITAAQCFVVYDVL